MPRDTYLLYGRCPLGALLFFMVGREPTLQGARGLLFGTFLVHLAELAAGEVGVQSPTTGTNTKGTPYGVPFVLLTVRR